MKEKIKKSSIAGRTMPGMRMKDLTEATGLPKSAILHYVAQGLLPEPVRTGPNMAYYDPTCIERIKLIKSIQTRYAFPLGKIKMILAQQDQGKDIFPFIELNETIFGGVAGPPLDEVAFRAATGLKAEEITALIENGLLLPLEQGSFNEEDVMIGGVYARGFALGIRISDLFFYAMTAKRIVDGEMRLRRRLTAHLPEGQDAELTRKLVQAARATRTYVIDRTFQRRVAAARNLKDERLLS